MTLKGEMQERPMNEATSNEQANEKLESASRQLPSILIVDDSRDAANVLKTLLDAHGYTSFVAYDWIGAIEGARKDLPDVMLLDLGMPELDGVHLARYFREDEQLKDRILIALTGYADDMHRSQCEAAGFDYVMAKPAAWDDLKATIDRLWAQRQS
jgi:CheY-like chemotaxis protein